MGKELFEVHLIYLVKLIFFRKLLIAACEGKQILLFDAANQNLLKTVENAHQNCVNCVR